MDGLPPLTGDLALPGLVAPVRVYRDKWGIPHIASVGPPDAYFALGFVHAQDRLFQMDLTRRRALGRAAEWLGPEAAESDILVRRLGMEAACRRDDAALGPDARQMLDSYAAGVNAFVASGAPLPIEYGLLGATFDPWQPWHSIAVMRRLGLLMGSVWFKLWRMLALPVVGAANAAKLRYDDSAGGDLLCIPPGVTAQRWTADLAALAPAVTALLDAMGADAGDGTGGGSNNWAVGPGGTSTGRPILAGDPHRVFEIPGMYAQHHLACDVFDTVGLTVPGVPGFPHFAHNGHVAYCVTHAFVDIHDLFLEQFDQAGALVRTPGGWAAVDTPHRSGGRAWHARPCVHHHGDTARAGHCRRPRGRDGAVAALGPVRRDGPVVRLPAAHDGCHHGRRAVRGGGGMGADRPQPGGWRHGGDHRPPGAGAGAAAAGGEWVAAGAGVDGRA